MEQLLTPEQESSSDLANKAKPLAETAKTVFEEGKEHLTENAQAVIHEAKERANSTLRSSKHSFASQISGIATALKHSGEELSHEGGLEQQVAQYTQTASIKMQELAEYLEAKDLRDITRDVENFARRQPAIFLGGAVAIGLLAARFIRSSASHHDRGAVKTQLKETPYGHAR
jgi:hypothetical protein